MRNLKLYAGIILILLTVILLAVTFFQGLLMETSTNHIVLGASLALIVVGIILIVLGGKSADKIGGK